MTEDHSQCVPLKEYVERIFTEKDKALSAALLASEKATAAALVAVKEENRKTEVAAEKRFELLNELRGDVATKAEVKAVEIIVEDLKLSRDTQAGKSAGLSQGMGIFLGVIGLIGTMLGIVGGVVAFTGG